MPSHSVVPDYTKLSSEEVLFDFNLSNNHRCNGHERGQTPGDSDGRGVWHAAVHARLQRLEESN